MRKLVFTLCVIATVSLAGCFDYDETLVLETDGSGTIQMKFGVDKSYLAEMQTISEQMAQAMPEADIPTDPKETMFNKARIEETLAGDDSGVELIAYVTSETAKSQVWDMKFSFKDWRETDILDVALSSDPIGDQYDEDYDEEAANEPPLLTQQEDGTWLFYRPFDDIVSGDDENGMDEEYIDDEEYGESSDEDYEAAEESENSPLGEEIEAGIEELTDRYQKMANESGPHTIRFSVTFPGDIIESNALRVTGRTAIWEYQMESMGDSLPAQRAVFK